MTEQSTKTAAMLASKPRKIKVVKYNGCQRCLVKVRWYQLRCPFCGDWIRAKARVTLLALVTVAIAAFLWMYIHNY